MKVVLGLLEVLVRRVECARVMAHISREGTDSMSGQVEEYMAKEPLIQFDIGRAVADEVSPLDAVRGWCL